MIGKRRLLASTGLSRGGRGGRQGRRRLSLGAHQARRAARARRRHRQSRAPAAPGLEKKLGVSILIDNRPDAAAVMGATIVTKAKPDGYTFYAGRQRASTRTRRSSNSLPYDTLKDFTAVTMVAQGPVILIVHPDVPAKTLQELIALAKKTELSYRLGRHRRLDPSRGRDGEPQGRHQDPPRAVQGLGPGAERAAGRPRARCSSAASARRRPTSRRARCGRSPSPATHRDPIVPDVPTFQEAG